jgi:hypothetical protein
MALQHRVCSFCLKTMVTLIVMALFAGNVEAQYGNWSRLPLEEGGVVDDIQFLYHAPLYHNALGDTLWSANQEGGLIPIHM